MSQHTFVKKDVVERVAASTGLDPQQTAKTVDSTFNILREMMIEGKDELRIEIRNFGVFEVKKTKAKPAARNPKTNEIVYVPPRRKTHFKPGKLIKEALKEPLAE